MTREQVAAIIREHIVPPYRYIDGAVERIVELHERTRGQDEGPTP